MSQKLNVQYQNDARVIKRPFGKYRDSMMFLYDALQLKY